MNTSQYLLFCSGTSFVLGALSTFFVSRLWIAQKPAVDDLESDSEDEEEDTINNNVQRYKMALVVRTDLKMTSGKIAARTHFCINHQSQPLQNVDTQLLVHTEEP